MAKNFFNCCFSFIFRWGRSCKCDTTSKGVIFRCKTSHISDELLDGHQDLKYTKELSSYLKIQILTILMCSNGYFPCLAMMNICQQHGISRRVQWLRTYFNIFLCSLVANVCQPNEKVWWNVILRTAVCHFKETTLRRFDFKWHHCYVWLCISLLCT